MKYTECQAGQKVPWRKVTSNWADGESCFTYDVINEKYLNFLVLTCRDKFEPVLVTPTPAEMFEKSTLA